jgi:hypothetical protein
MFQINRSSESAASTARIVHIKAPGTPADDHEPAFSQFARSAVGVVFSFAMFVRIQHLVQ